jgi:hypothetical protein
MITGQTFYAPATSATFRVIEAAADGTRAIAAGLRTGARVMVFEAGPGYYARRVTDNGASGPSLFDSLAPAGARFKVLGPGRAYV